MSKEMNRRDFGRLAATLVGVGALSKFLPESAFAQQAVQTAAAPAEQSGISIGTLVMGFPGAPVAVRPATAGAAPAPAPQEQPKKRGGPSILNPFGGLGRGKKKGAAEVPTGQPPSGAAPVYAPGPSTGPQLEYQFFIVNDGSSKYYIMPMPADMNKPAGNIEDPTTDFSIGIGATLRVVVADANGYAKVKTLLNAQELDVTPLEDKSGRSVAMNAAMILDVAAAINDKHVQVDMQSHFPNAATGAMAVPIGVCSPTDCSNLANLHEGKGTTVLGFDANLYSQLNVQPYFVQMVKDNEADIAKAKEAAAEAAKPKAAPPKAPARKGTTATRQPAAPAPAPVEIPPALTVGDVALAFSSLPKNAPRPAPNAKPHGLQIK